MVRLTVFLVAALALAGCGGVWQTNYDAPVASEVSRGWSLGEVRVSVPETLTTTEMDSFAPDADIVWHGEPLGDRRAQVAALMRDGIARGASGLPGRRAVDIDIEVLQFHAVTPLAVLRAPEAVHDIRYIARVRDARTGAVLVPPTEIQADVEALVGAVALEALAQGETQKVRITRHLAAVTAGWLGIGPDPRRSFESLGR